MLRMMLPFFILAGAANAQAAPRALSTDRFANVFVEGQPVRITVAAGEAVDLVLRDLDGKEQARRAVPAATAPTTSTWAGGTRLLRRRCR